MSEHLSGEAGIAQDVLQQSLIEEHSQLQNQFVAESSNSTSPNKVIALITAIAAVGTLITGQMVKQKPAHATAPLRTIVGTPFQGKWAADREVTPPYTNSNSSHPSVHPSYSSQWATDLYAGEGTSAYAYGTSPDGGDVTFKRNGTSDTCSSHGANIGGKGISLDVRVNGNKVGELKVDHLDLVDVGDEPFGSGTKIGEITSEAKHASCYQVDHAHIQFKNTVANESCYIDHGKTGQVLSADTPLGILGSSNTEPRQACSTGNTTPPDPDPDGDGLPNSRDNCDNEAGPASNNGCPLPVDTDLDTVFDPDDLAPLNPGPQANRGFPTHQRTVTGDFNGDNRDDLAIFYDYGNGHTRLWQFNGAPDGLVNSPALRWDSNVGNWPANGMKNAVADINADGYDDVVTFYDYGADGIRAQGFYGTPNGLTGPQLRWYSGPGNWHWPAVHLVGGDFDGDGRGEIGAFYDSGNNHTKLWVFRDVGLGLEEGDVPAWDSGPNRWAWIAMKNVVTDVNNDGKDDIVSLYDFGNRVCTFVFNGSSSGITAPGDQPQWCSDPGTYWPNIQLVSGDFDGNSFGDVGIVYDYGNNVTRTWTMSGSANGLTAPQSKWESNSWAWRASKWNAGDYNGDGRTDIGAFYDYGSGRTKHWVLYGTPTGPSNNPAEDWDSGVGNNVNWWRF